MNNKIKDLVKKADGVIIQKMMTGRKQYTFLEDDFERFVVSIVRECHELRNHDDVLAPVGHSVWGEAYQEGWTDGVASYGDTILTHFGV